MTEKSRT